MLDGTLQRISEVDFVAVAKRLKRRAGAMLSRVAKFEEDFSTNLGKLWGTPVWLKPSTLLLAGALAWIYSPVIVPIGFLGLIIHEYAHIYRAKAFNITTKEVVLTGMGGEARMIVSVDDDEFLTNGRAEWEVGLAGPMSSFVLATIGFVGATLLMAFGIPHETMLLFGQVNLALGAFNMLPILPMDGGRVVRGLANQHLDSWKNKITFSEWVRGSKYFWGGVGFTAIFVAPFLSVILYFQIGAQDKELEKAERFYAWKLGQQPKAIPIEELQGDWWWKTLGLKASPTSLKDVKRAYRKKLPIHHPDRGGSDASMRHLVRAYDAGKAALG